MKVYFRILSYAKPLGKIAVPYFLFSFLSTLFGLMNFSLLVPILQVLFGTNGSSQESLQKLAVQPVWQGDFAKIGPYILDNFNYYMASEALAHGTFGALRFVSLILISSFFFSNLFRYLSQMIVEELKVRFVRNLRTAVFEKTTSMHLAFFSNERKGDIMARITADVQEVENSIANTLTGVLKEPITLVTYFVVLINLSWELTLFTMLVLPVSGVLIGWITKRLKSYANSSQMAQGRMITILDETLSGMRIVKGFNAIKYVREKFTKENELYTSLNLRMAKRRELAPPVSEFMGAIVIVCILLYGGTLVLGADSKMDASRFVTYIVIFSQIMRPAKTLTSSFSGMQKGIASGERIFGLIDTPIEILDKPNAKKLLSFEKSIEFRNVSFAYGERQVLHNISFTVNKGEMVALVGPSGGGKSTIADLIPRFYDAAEGQVLIDGVDIKDYDIESVRNFMGIVTQESILFNDSIRNNIAFSTTNATLEQVTEAAKVANAHDFISATEEGYETGIGDRGVRLSGGQRQRLSIARAVLRNPAILILDEATSALDTESEKLVQNALDNLMQNRTSLVIAHRLSTIQNADKILVIENGHLIEQGNHQELLAADSGLYKRLQALQQTEKAEG
jgi:subfamily B ATP-binding cassette protein MsbA